MTIKAQSIARGLLLLLATAVFSAQAQTTGAPAAAGVNSVATRSFVSEALGREMPYRVVLPAGYSNGQQRYPVLYLLHGWNGDETNWVKLTHLVEDAAKYPLIIVMPRAENSWYVNSATRPADRFADYIATDLIADVDAHFRTIAAPHERAVAGLSMGGYGALLLTLKYAGIFGFAGSISGAFAGPSGVEDVLPQLRASTDQAYGPPGSATRKDNDVDTLIAAADPAAVPYLFLECGTSDPLLSSNRLVVSELSAHKLAYEYHELPGAHTWSFWDNALPTLLQVVADHLDLASAVGATPSGSGERAGARRKDFHDHALPPRP
jgi:S-formylglutathione hydrolase FrmB